MNAWFLRLARVGTVLALFVVPFGAYVRATDAGLGCPDWPGCYGRLVVPDPTTSAHDLGAAYARPLEPGKAWREMIHRYLATTLGLICVSLALIAWFNRRDPEQPRYAPLALLGLIVFQGLLGMWTVTLLLKPLIVVGHLLGGMATLALLALLARWRTIRLAVSSRALRVAGVLAAAALVVQIALGGWTSANYAALACPDFPTCDTQWWPALANFKEGFTLWRSLGVNYEGGVLDHRAQVAIHFTHRLGALAATLFIAVFAVGVTRLRPVRADGLAVLVALLLQLSLGVSIVEFGVPLWAAVAHNCVAALLLLTVLNANQRIRQR